MRITYLQALLLSAILAGGTQMPSYGQGTFDPALARGAVLSALFHGVRLTIPTDLSGSVSFWNSGMHPLRETDTEAAMIVISLRQMGYKPMLTKSDLQNWATHWLIPYEKNIPQNRWITVSVRRLDDFLQGGVSTLPDQFFRETHSEYVRSFSCAGKQYGLTHCTATTPSNRNLPGEWFVDQEGQSTLISCSMAPNNVGLRQCVHYFRVPELHAYAQTYYSSEEEVSNWKANESGILSIANKIEH